MERQNLRKFTMSRAVILALCAVMLITAGCGGRRAEQARQRGEIHLRNNDASAAKAQFEQALELDPESARAQAGLAHSLRQLGETEAALEGYERAIEMDPQVEDAYTAAVRLLIGQERFAEAEEWAARYREVNGAQGGVLLSAVYRASGRMEQATALLESLTGEYPDSVPIRTALALDYLSLGRGDEAESTLQTVLDANPDAVQARMALIEVYRVLGKLPAIEEQLRGMIESAEAQLAESPGDSGLTARIDGLKLQLALTMLETGKAEEALELVEPLVKARPDSPWANFTYGSVLLALDQESDGIQALQSAAAALPDEPLIARRLAAARGERRPEPAQTREPAQETAESADAPPADPVARAGDWRSLWREAQLQTLVQERDTLTDRDNPLLKEILVASAMFAGNSAALEELVPALPEDAPLRQIVESLRNDEAEQVRTTLDAWTETDPVRVILRNNVAGYIYAVAGARGRALQTFFETARDYPENVVAFYNIAGMYNAAGMPQFAAQAMRRLLQRYPDSLEGRVLLYQTLRRAGALDDARSTAETTFGIYPEERDAVLNLADVYLDSGEVDMAVTVLRSGASVRQGDPGLQLALSSALLRAGQPVEAEEALAATEFPESLTHRAAESKAFAAAAQSDWAKADTALAEEPNDSLSTAGQLLKASLAIRNGEADEARAIVETLAASSAVNARKTFVLSKALGLDAEGETGAAQPLVDALNQDSAALADFAFVLAAMDNRIYRQAYDTLSEMTGTLGYESPLVTLMFASLASPSAGGDRVEKAEELSTVSPESAQPWLGLAAVYESAGMSDKQGEAIRSAVEQNPESQQVWLALAFYAGKEGLDDEALRAYRRLIELGANDPRIFNNYAYYLLGSGEDAAEALTYAERATAELTRDPHAIHTLGLAQLENGQNEAARETLGRALEMLPGDPTFMLDLGRAFIANGEVDEGRPYIEQALRNADQLGLEFPRRSEAEAILQEG
jgi:Tfp pilus assembly protein PilF